MNGYANKGTYSSGFVHGGLVQYNARMMVKESESQKWMMYKVGDTAKK